MEDVPAFGLKDVGIIFEFFDTDAAGVLEVNWGQLNEIRLSPNFLQLDADTAISSTHVSIAHIPILLLLGLLIHNNIVCLVYFVNNQDFWVEYFFIALFRLFEFFVWLHRW